MDRIIDRITLKTLFETSLYLDIVQIDVRKSDRIFDIKKIDYDPLNQTTLSPASETLLSYFSPETQKKLAGDFIRDELAITNSLKKLELDDPDYINFDPKSVGIYLEFWVCVNIPCPGCKHKLYKYANPNMPVVDVRCINPHHNNTMGPIYYQIKATNKGTTYLDYKYFSYDKNYISVGSVDYGKICHEITADNIDYRDILIGYICIEYNYTDDILNTINIDMDKSFILIPNLQFKPTILQKDLTYYRYIRTVPSPIITFNNNMVINR